MTVTALYRISSNEVIKTSLSGQTFDDPRRDASLWAVLTDPTTPDGTDVRDNSDPQNLGPLREFGFAKIAEPGGNNIRDATAPEIGVEGPPPTGFWLFKDEDEKQQDADRAADLGDLHPRLRKIFKALLKGIVRENNIMATRWNEFRAEVALATSLPDLQTRVADNTSDTPIRTNQQAFDALRPDTDKDD